MSINKEIIINKQPYNNRNEYNLILDNSLITRMDLGIDDYERIYSFDDTNTMRLVYVIADSLTIYLYDNKIEFNLDLSNNAGVTWSFEYSDNDNIKLCYSSLDALIIKLNNYKHK